MQRWLLRPGAAATTVGQLAAFAGGVHVARVQHHFGESTVFGWLFLVLGAALLFAGGVLMLSGKVWAWRAAGASAAIAALTYLVSRTGGVPGLSSEAWELRGMVTASVEGAIAIAALVAGLSSGRAPSTPPAPKDPAWLLALAARER